MKKLILWLLMVVLFVAVLLGGTVGAIYYMTDEGDMPAETATFGGVALENVGYEWDVPVLGGVVYKNYYEPSTLTVQQLGDLGSERPELVLPDWVSQADLTLTAPDGTVAYQGDAAGYADFAYTQNGQYTLSLTLRQLSTDKPAKPIGWYLYQASFTVQFEPKVELSKTRAAQGDAVAILLTGVLGDGTPQAGVVDYAGTLQLTGGTVVIDHGCGVKSYLFGLGEVSVQRGQTVQAGELVGKAAADHDLIYEIRIANKSVDPALAIKGQSGLQYRENLSS